MAFRVCIILAVCLCAATVVFAVLWVQAERRCQELVARTRELDEIRESEQDLRDSLRIAAGRSSSVENLQSFWYDIAREAEANQRMLLSRPDIRRLKKLGLSDPVTQLRRELVAHPELIPYEGVLGGQMHFGEPRVTLLSTRWVFAEFEDGHIGGSCLLEYSVSPGGRISWKLLVAKLS